MACANPQYLNALKMHDKSCCDQKTESLSSIKPRVKNIETNTVIVFDFDDTLFPTTKLKEIMKRSTTNSLSTNTISESQLLLSKMTENELIEFIHLSLVTFNLLTTYIAKYSIKNICIVTASGNGWIQSLLKTVYSIGYFSNIYHLLFNDNNNQNQILIINPLNDISASFKTNNRKYNNFTEYPVFKWKFIVFKQLFESKYYSEDDVINTFVFIGDSEWEYVAANKLRDCVEGTKINVFIDRVKLIRKPSFNELKKEQLLLNQLCAKYEQFSCVNKIGFDVDYLAEQQRLLNKKREATKSRRF